MSLEPAVLRGDFTPFLLFPELSSRGGGLAKAVADQSSLYARHYERVVILTTGFSPKIDAVVAQLKARGSIDERVVVRNFFQHSRWVTQLGVPPEGALAAFDPAEIVSEGQRLPGGPVLRIADRNVGERFPRGYRYFDTAQRLLLTTSTWPKSGHERVAKMPGSKPRTVPWAAIVAGWVDEEMTGANRPVLFSLKRGLNDQVLIASTSASRKVASLHNCHLADPEHRRRGVRPVWRPLLDNARRVDEIVCLTKQQRRELSHDVRGTRLTDIPHPAQPPQTPPGRKDLGLVVMVARLVPTKRIHDAIRAFALVVPVIAEARLEIYGAGVAEPQLQRLIEELGLTESVQLMGYSYAVAAAQARAACTLLTSKFEGYALVISESMSLGTPVIAYDIRYGPRFLIRPWVDGVLVEVKEPTTLAAVILDLLLEPDRAVAMGTRASKITERLPIAAWEQSWLDVVAHQPSAWERTRAQLHRGDLGRRLRRRVRKTISARNWRV